MEMVIFSDSKGIKITKVICIGVMLVMGLMVNIQGLAGIDTPSGKVLYGDPLGKNHFALTDAVSGSQEFYGYTPVPEHQPLEIHTSDAPEFWYTAVSPYYKVYFKGNTVRMSIQNAWIEYELEHVKTVVQKPEGNQLSTEKPKIPEIAKSVVNQNTLSVSNVFESVNVSYTADTSVLTETLVLTEPKQLTRVIQKIQWESITPEYQEDGSILFLDENGEKIVKILPPFMEDAAQDVCEHVHYELIETEAGHELHKVIDEKGLEWLENAVYPVVIDRRFR